MVVTVVITTRPVSMTAAWVLSSRTQPSAVMLEVTVGVVANERWKVME